jgi:hypothetical protein
MTEMADGQTDILVGEDQDIREALVIRPVTPNRALSYKAGAACSYTYEYTTTGSQTEIYRYRVVWRPLGDDRILLSHTYDGGVGTVIIDQRGTLHDFNLWAPEHSRRISADDFGPQGEWLGRPSAAGYDFRRDLTVLFPSFQLTTPSPGDVVAFIHDQNGQVWSRYIYRGLTNVRGIDAIVLDLVRDHSNKGRLQEVVIGFAILSADGLVPLYQASNGLRGPTRTRRAGCEG